MIQLIPFKKEDIQVLSPIMKEAFDEDSRIHLNGKTSGPKGYDNGEFISHWFMEKSATAYTIVEDGTPIGGVNLFINKNGVNYLGYIFISPDKENKGYGLKVWKMIEKAYPNTKIWKTETPIFSHRNHNFYVNKCGFSIIHINNPKDLNEGSFLLEKRLK